MHDKYVRDLLFADDAAITTHTQEDLAVMWQDIKEIPLLFIHNYKLEVVHEFVYLGSTITDNLSIDSELDK